MLLCNLLARLSNHPVQKQGNHFFPVTLQFRGKNTNSSHRGSSTNYYLQHISNQVFCGLKDRVDGSTPELGDLGSSTGLGTISLQLQVRVNALAEVYTFCSMYHLYTAAMSACKTVIALMVQCKSCKLKLQPLINRLH